MAVGTLGFATAPWLAGTKRVTGAKPCPGLPSWAGTGLGEGPAGAEGACPPA